MSQQKAIFLDRDGVINNPGGNYYVYQIENFVINEGIIEFIKEVKNRGYLVIVISNQGGIAKKYYSQDDVERLHEHMRNVFAKENVHVDEIYYCPHHTDIENCLCRKPDSQMLKRPWQGTALTPLIHSSLETKTPIKWQAIKQGLTPFRSMKTKT
jgi:D-glycero-D-manno-heptose 1,7-bisphosphate phosphatase